MTYSARKNLTIPVEAGEAIVRGQMLAEGTAGTTGKAVVAGADDTLVLGVAQTTAEVGETVTVALLGSGESQWVTAGGAIARFAEVQLGADGVVVTEGTGSRGIVGQALEAAQTGERIEVRLYPQVDVRA